MKLTHFLYLLMLPVSLMGQNNVRDASRALKASEDLTRIASKDLEKSEFVSAEANFRKATSKSNQNHVAPYNLGNAFYGRESYGEAFGQYKDAGERAAQKGDKHKAFHNMGNVYMKKKEYQKAVEAYKEALRNNPSDEESRYNLALAKELAKKDQENQQQNQDQNEDQENQQDQQENEQENQDQNEGENKEDQQNQDKKQDGDSEKEEQQKGDGNQKQEQDRKPQEQEQPQQPRPNQLSPQQIQNLLQAMENEEKKVKEKIDAQKVKGPQIKTEKDW